MRMADRSMERGFLLRGTVDGLNPRPRGSAISSPPRLFQGRNGGGFHRSWGGIRLQFPEGSFRRVSDDRPTAPSLRAPFPARRRIWTKAPCALLMAPGVHGRRRSRRETSKEVPGVLPPLFCRGPGNGRALSERRKSVSLSVRNPFECTIRLIAV